MFARLLAGDPSVTIQSLTVRQAEREVVCIDPEVLDYFEQRMRQAVWLGEHANGSLCYLALSFNDGASVSVHMWATRTLWGVCVPGEGLEPGWPSHDVAISEPMPHKVRAMLDFLLDETKNFEKRMIVAQGRPIEIVDYQPGK
jgi:hypothetical protein